jgi:F-type H+-transporting ATPase subunit delta
MRTKIEDVIKDISGGKPQIEEQIDSTLIGGIVIKIGDTVIDGSIKNKLKQLKRELV